MKSSQEISSQMELIQSTVSFHIWRDFLCSQLPLRCRLSKYLSLSFSLTPLTSPLPSFTHKLLLPMTERHTYSDPSSVDRDFTREENFSTYPGGLILIWAAPTCQVRRQETFCVIFNVQSFSLKFRVLLSSHHQNYLAVSLPWELRI